MAEKRLNARVSESEFLAVKHSADTVGLTVAEFTRFAALNIGKKAEGQALESAALGEILDRLDGLESRLSDPSPNGGRVPSQHANGDQSGPTMTEVGEAIGDLFAGQKHTESALQRTDDTLQNVVQTLAKIFDHLNRQASPTAPTAAPQPAPNPTPPAVQKAETFRRCRPGGAHQEWINSDEQPRAQREDFYRRNLRKFVELVGWDSRVTPDQYAWAGMTPPAGLYDQ